MAKTNQKTNIAAIDLGSNALRAVIAHLGNKYINVIDNFRDALRLGNDVFFTGAISSKKMEDSENAFIRLLNKFAEYNVTQVTAIATSALRNAANKNEFVESIYHLTGIRIKIINGLEEARLIHKAVSSQYDMKGKTSLLIDIGGGSTELTIAKGMSVLSSRSFKIGTVRLLNLFNKHELELKVDRQIAYMKKYVRDIIGDEEIDICVGTGGNLRRIGKLKKKMLYKASPHFATNKDVSKMYDILVNLTFQERMEKFNMRADRADVIVPATYIVKRMMESLKIVNINLPSVGLKEGILLDMCSSKMEGFIHLD